MQLFFIIKRASESVTINLTTNAAALVTFLRTETLCILSTLCKHTKLIDIPITQSVSPISAEYQLEFWIIIHT